MRTIIEPFRIKMTEPIPITKREDRERWLTEAHNNLFLLAAETITIDLLTDSGTGAMSTRQWAALMQGDESYAGSQSWTRLRSVVQDITGFSHIFPVHQGRAAERILAQILIKPGHVIPNNGHFDTTRANFEFAGAEAVDFPAKEGRHLSLDHPFKGNMDLDGLRRLIKETEAERIPFAMVTVTNNSFGGQPVSLENLRAVREILKPHGIPLFLDAARFAENSFFIHEREAGQKDRPLIDIARDLFACADGFTLSAKKDGLVNTGGLFATKDPALAEEFRNVLILTEGFPTYGGLAGRDLETMAVGLREALEMDYQVYRHATVRYMETKLSALGIPVMRPAGGHAIYLDVGGFYPHLPRDQYPGISLINELYLEGGVRAVEMGSVMFGRCSTSHRSVAVEGLPFSMPPRRLLTPLGLGR
ncbi:MAG: tryptophanase [Nitrospinaceae bacterium]